jgi:phospholipid transport system substrate-binding protein
MTRRLLPAAFQLVLLLMFAALPPATMSAPANPAATTIQNFYDELLATMKDGSQLGMQGRYKRLAPAVDAAFDLPTMTAFAVGPNWASYSPADQKALTDAFRRMTIASYASNFKSYDGEKFMVAPDTKQAGTDQVVLSQLVPAKGDPVSLNYRMRQAAGGWKIIDVYSAGYVSELARRRSDFSGIVASGGAAALIKKLNDLSDNMLKGS